MIRKSTFLKDSGLKEKIAEIVESHIGVGLTISDVKKINADHGLRIPEKDYLPQTLEAKIVAYADKLVEREEKDFMEQLEEKREEFGTESRIVKTLEEWNRDYYKYYKK